MISMFMCYTYDFLRGDGPVSCPVFFQTFEQALRHAKKDAIIIEPHWYRLLNTEHHSPGCIFYVKIFEIPFGYHVPINNEFGFENYELEEMCIKTIYNPPTCAAMVIQRKWRTIYNTRLASAAIIRKHMKLAIVNPYTQLGRNRLLREFAELGVF